MSKNVLIVLGGLPASGKSTYAEMLQEINPTFQRVCPDLIRKAFYGDENIQGDGKRIFATAFHDMREYGCIGANVIFDATNIDRKRRTELVAEMRPYFDIIIFKWFDIRNIFHSVLLSFVSLIGSQTPLHLYFFISYIYVSHIFAGYPNKDKSIFSNNPYAPCA